MLLQVFSLYALYCQTVAAKTYMGHHTVILIPTEKEDLRIERRPMGGRSEGSSSPWRQFEAGCDV